ncbi:hypothetical protein SDC9_185482 [bioreactor metagenome]|uniref:Uncharacterized protein n=1 Tax=bioreactor metagenome TaxID=1076179 RepID=A0A645HG25_9ZZZZ
MPMTFDMTNAVRVTGLDIRRRTVPFFISRLIVCPAHSTATTSPKRSVVAIELSMTSFICSLNTNIESVGNMPIMTSAVDSMRK